MLTGEFPGQWWLPGRPKKRLGGVLTFAEGEAPTLQVIGGFADFQTRFGASPKPYPVILGVTSLGKAVTLIDAYESNSQLNLMAPGSGETTLTASHAYVGAHYIQEDKASFRSVVFRMSGFDAWFSAPPIERELEILDGELKKAVLTYVPADEVKIRPGFGTLSLGYDFRAAGNLRTEARLVQESRIVAARARPKPLDWWLSNVVKPLRYLISLATEQPVEVQSFYARRGPTGAEGRVEVVWDIDVPRRPARHLRTDQMLFWYGDLEPRFEQAMRNWYTAVRKLEDVFDQYFATLNTSRSYVETRFLMTVQAAEAYHRERFGGTDARPSVHRQRVRQARAGVDRRHLDWLNARLTNDPTLVQRITELCQFVPEVTQLLAGGDAQSFARAVRDARNYRTHMDRRTSAPGRDSELLVLSAQMGALLEAVIMRRELGFDASDVAGRIARASRLRRLAEAAKSR